MITEARLVVRAWLANYWNRADRARELARQYQAMQEVCPAAVADLARFCMAFDTTFDADNERVSLVNQGKREVWLHMQEMLGLDRDDFVHLKGATEQDG